MHGANYFHLSGWFTVASVTTIQGIGEPVIYGYVHIQKPKDCTEVNVTSYPVVLTGKPANIILDYARQAKRDCPRVMVHGRMAKQKPNSEPVLLVRFLEILDVDTKLLDPQKTQKAPDAHALPLPMRA